MQKIRETLIRNLSMRYRPLIDDVDLIESTAAHVVEQYTDEPIFTQRLARKMVDDSIAIMESAVKDGLCRKANTTDRIKKYAVGYLL